MISQTAEYALRTMVTLAECKEDYMSAPEIAILTQVPFDYLSKILQLLAKASLLKIKRGVNGGYSLRKTPQEISVLSVIELFDEISRIRECPLKRKEHAHGLCPLHKTLDQTACDLIQRLGSVFLSDLINSSNKSLC